MQRVKREAFPSSSNVFVKAVDDETGEIVGVSQFEINDDGKVGDGPMKEDAEPPGDWPEGGNWALKRFFAIWSYWLPVESFSGRPYLCMLSFFLRFA